MTAATDPLSGLPSRCDVAVVGAGVAGLTAAYAAATHGLGVVVFEADAIPGGRARSWTDPVSGDSVDIGPHILLNEYTNFRRLLDELGREHAVCWQRDKFLQLVDGDRQRVDVRLAPLPPPLHLLPLLVQPPLPLSARLSNLRVGWHALRFDESMTAALDRVDAETLLRRLGVQPRMIDWVWRTTCMTRLNVPLERCSAAALLRVFAQMAGRRGFHAGFARCGLSELYAYPAVAAIRRAGGDVRLSTTVSRVSPAEDGVCVQLGDGRRVIARHCVLAVPPQAIDDLLASTWHALPVADAARTFVASRYLCTMLWFDRRLRGERFWSGVWAPDRLNYDFYDLTTIREGWEQRGGTVIVANAMYSQRLCEGEDGAADGGSDDEIIRRTHAELAQAVPAAATARIVHARVHRVPMGIPCPFPGSETQRPDVCTGVDRLYVAGDWVRTGLPASMESAARAGWMVAERILAAESRPRRLSQPPAPPTGVVRWLRR